MAVKKFYSGTIRKQVLISASPDKVWRTVTNVGKVAGQLDEIRRVSIVSKTKRGLGTIRELVFADGSIVEEHTVLWNPKHSFSYVAITGLPMRVYHATFSIRPKSKRSAYLVLSTYLSSEKMTERQFEEFVLDLDRFYVKMLEIIRFQSET